MEHDLPKQKRLFDVMIICLSMIVLVPVLIACVLAIVLTDGRPVFYVSTRRVHRSRAMRIVKFRTMRRNADKIANRDTVPVTTTRFLNIPPTSPLYTPAGRWIERLMLTELPQVWHVLQGKMTFIGNRPLPENVIAALRAEHPGVEARFATPAGLTGPVQLVGRDHISDAERLQIESAYCAVVHRGYSPVLDFKILLYTVLVGMLPDLRLNPQQVLRIITPDGAHGRTGVPTRWPTPTGV